LSGTEAKSQLARFGPNLFRERQEKSLLLQYLTRFKNPLVIILLVASAVSAFTGEVTNFLIISFIVLLSVTLDFIQEYRANAAAEKLRQSVSVRATVIRDGRQLQVPVAQVVPGDIVAQLRGPLVNDATRLNFPDERGAEARGIDPQVTPLLPREIKGVETSSRL